MIGYVIEDEWWDQYEVLEEQRANISYRCLISIYDIFNSDEGSIVSVDDLHDDITSVLIEEES